MAGRFKSNLTLVRHHFNVEFDANQAKWISSRAGRETYLLMENCLVFFPWKYIENEIGFVMGHNRISPANQIDCRAAVASPTADEFHWFDAAWWPRLGQIESTSSATANMEMSFHLPRQSFLFRPTTSALLVVLYRKIYFFFWSFPIFKLIFTSTDTILIIFTLIEKRFHIQLRQFCSNSFNAKVSFDQINFIWSIDLTRIEQTYPINI